MTQFAFLQTEFPEVFALARKAELTASTDARGSCFHARLALEAAVKWMYAHDRSLRSPYDIALSALIHEGTFRALVGNALVTKARIIKDSGRNLNANQIEFVNLIIEHLTERGAMDPRRLYETPLTDFNDQGVTGIFPPADVQKIVQLLYEVRRKAAA